MDQDALTRPDQVGEVYRRTLSVVHDALVTYYRLTDDEALKAERDLEVWFYRLTRRSGAVQMPVKALRLSLLTAACQYGRCFQLWKLGGSTSEDTSLNEVLAREPQDIVGDLKIRLDKDP